MALTEEQLDALIGAAAENKVGRDTYFFSNDELVAMQERFLATIVPPASEQKPFAWFAKNDITDLLEIEWTTSKPIYEGIWEPLFRKPYESFCHEERPCTPCFTDNGPCADAPDYKEQRDALLGKVIQVRQALQFANDTSGGGINDTIWMMHGPETLFDFLDAAIASAKGDAK